MVETTKFHSDCGSLVEGEYRMTMQALAESEVGILRECLRTICCDKAVRQQVRNLFGDVRCGLPHYSLADVDREVELLLSKIEADITRPAESGRGG